jgi:hypothetical protein
MTQTDLHSLVSDSAGQARTTTLSRENGLHTLLLYLNAANGFQSIKRAVPLPCIA